MIVSVKYTGKFPYRCRGRLEINIGGAEWDFGEDVLGSGGSIIRDSKGEYHATKGPWAIIKWPKNFPEEYKEAVLEAVNKKIELGCCGGCTLPDRPVYEKDIDSEGNN